MRMQTLIEARKKAGLMTNQAPSLAPSQRPSFAARTDEALPLATLAEQGRGHDLGQMSIQPSVTPEGDGSPQPIAQSCPLPAGPRACPFGGACHTCPVAMQTKLNDGQLISRPEKGIGNLAMGVDYLTESRASGGSATPESARTHTSASQATSGNSRLPCCTKGNAKGSQLQSDILDSLLPADREERAKFVGSLFAGKAVGVEGRWLSEHLSTGFSLEPDIMSEMENTLEADLSGVRIHTDNNANLVAQTLGARAVTIGQHIAFAKGQFSPKREAGRNLLVHELVHTIQQQKNSVIPSGTIPITRANHSSEREADAIAGLAAIHSIGQVDRYVSSYPAPQVNLSMCDVVVEASCWAFFAAIAAAIAALCTAGSVITFGGLAIPCTPLVIASAGLAAWDAVMCTNVLTDAICGGERIAEASAASPSTEAEA